MSSHINCGFNTEGGSMRTYISIVVPTVADGSTPFAMKLECMRTWSYLRTKFGCTSEGAKDIFDFLVNLLCRLRNLHDQHIMDDRSRRYLTSTITYCSGLQDGYKKQHVSTGDNGKEGGPHCLKPDPTFKPFHPIKSYERPASRSTGRQQKRKRTY